MLPYSSCGLCIILKLSGLIRTTFQPFAAVFNEYEKALHETRDHIKLEFTLESTKYGLRDQREADVFRFQSRQQWSHQDGQLIRIQQDVAETKRFGDVFSNGGNAELHAAN